MSENFAALLDESLNTLEMQPGTIVSGVVLDLDKEWVTVHVGLKSEGVIPLDEFKDVEGKVDINVGDEIEAKILTFDREERKMSLGVKQLTPDPWTDITKKYPVDSKHKGIVRNFTNFGVFVELEEGVDGLIYISDLSWTKKIKHPREFCNTGEKIEVIVLELDVENRKLSLGHKQLTENPWNKYENEFALDTIHNSEIFEIVPKGATVKFNDDVIAFIPSRHMVKEDGSKLQKGESVDLKVIEFNKDSKRVVLSHTQTFKDIEEINKKVMTKKMQDDKLSSKNTLGDANEQLQELKDKMDGK